tara:strand:+ start:2448 stop:2954 length:507 start_codon:yes stop_codon:yes gene_type:complete
MANANSTLVTNFEATPPTPNDVANLGGKMRVACGTISLPVDDLSATDTVMLAGIPTNAAVVSIKLFNDDLDSTTGNITTDVGLYTSDGNVTAKDDDCYASAITDLRAPVTAGTEVAFEARDINKMGQKVWQDAGDSSDPGGTYNVGLKFDAAGNTAGDLSWLITYIVD